MKNRILIFAAFCAVLLAFNGGCTLFGTGEGCDDIGYFGDGHYHPMTSFSIKDGTDTTPAGQALESARTMQLARDGVLTSSYTLPDGRQIEETWQVVDTRIVRYDTNDNSWDRE